MTVVRPSQSPTSPRARVSNPWPTASTSKPLPETPTYHRDHDMGGAGSIGSQGQQRHSHDAQGISSVSEQRGHTSSAEQQAINGVPGQDGSLATASAMQSIPSLDGTKSLPRPVGPNSVEGPSSINFTPASNNPFRQKELTINTKSGSKLVDADPRSRRGANLNVENVSPQSPQEPVGHVPNATSRISDQAPRLQWADPRSPVDPTGFSGGYFTELQELQQGIINAGTPKNVELGPQEAEAAYLARKSDLQATPPEIVDGPPLSIPSPQHLPQMTTSTAPSVTRNTTQSTASRPSSTKGMGNRASTASESRFLGDQRRMSPSPRSTSEAPSPGDQRSPFRKPSPPANAVQAETSTRGNQSVSPKPRKTSEVYQIRQVNWYDATSPTNPRRSPIMVQNENGPCPLLALVNALVLSTPSILTTALCETLRLREQVTLGLLLDAVIEELMSERRSGTASDLPDVGDLYTFLVGLHSGMSVNPRFVPARKPNTNSFDAPGARPLSSDRRRVGEFEETKEMKLYGTFGLPVIHGWNPPNTHPAFEVFARVAPTYEEAQNILFLEEDLEKKLKDEGLSPADQRLLEDIGRINHFLNSTATQLTGYGLESISECLAPGSVSILFRNDHFSTLYKHPRSGQLLTLVTDMGYAGHDEVVWESLVDVSGEGSEFYAGDFRPVGNVVETTEHTGVDEEGWETVTRRPRKLTRPEISEGQAQSQAAGAGPMSGGQISGEPPKSSEQEDLDFAIALSLQDEEDDNLRRQNAARRRQDELSERYLNDSDPATGRRTFPGFGRGARGAPPTVPPRGGRSLISMARQAPSTHRPASSNEDLPPPSYEQAAQGVPYHPPPDHPAHPSSSPHSHHRTGSAYAENSNHRAGGNASSPDHGVPTLPRRPKGRSSWGHSDGAGGGGGGVARRSQTARESGNLAGEEGKKEKERECVIM